MKLLYSLTFALAATTSVALADAPKEAAKEDVSKWLAFFDKIVDTIVADKADCTKMAGDINKLVDTNKDLLDKADEAKAKGLELPKDAKEHMNAGIKKMMPAMQEKCMNDKGVQGAMERMGGKSDKPAAKTPDKAPEKPADKPADKPKK